MGTMAMTLQPHGPASEQDIAEVEHRLGITFPPGYRGWLLTVGGGILTEHVAVPGTDHNGLINQFESVDKLVRYRDFEPHALIPPGYTVIALGDGGSLAIRTAEDDYGSVWWADFDKADAIDAACDTPEGPTPEIMSRLAADFPSLLTLQSTDPPTASSSVRNHAPSGTPAQKSASSPAKESLWSMVEFAYARSPTSGNSPSWKG